MDRSTIRCLYIEDDPLSREVMNIIMNNALHVEELVMFEDSVDVLKRIHDLAFCPDLILTDVYLHPFNGFQILDMVRADPVLGKCKIVALTASVMNEEVEQLRASGFDSAIAKPISVTTFPGLLDRILQGEAVWHIT